jgi:hypothetical protein
MSRIKAAYEAWQTRRIIRNLRENFAWFGFPLDDMTDEEIIEGAVRVGEAVRLSGVTVAEATLAFRNLQTHLSSASNPWSV